MEGRYPAQNVLSRRNSNRLGAYSVPVHKFFPFSLQVAAGRPTPSSLRHLMSDLPKVGLCVSTVLPLIYASRI